MKKTISLILFIALAYSVLAQSVGLVLSGGGAKGIAHVGVIKVLEENGIPIDYVAGTSIGAIVGGLYAAGYSPDEMLELFRSDQFKLWSTGKINKDDLYFFKRLEEQADWLAVDLAREDDELKVYVPTNIIPQTQMDFAFMELMASTNAVCENDFDQLMVPFRCISADVYNSKAMVHRQGNLDEAIRASMTFPFVFKPIEIDGTLLFDGGIINNFPVDVMLKDFNPDIIIGHKVADAPKKPNPDDLYEQIQSLIMQNTDYSVPDSLGFMLETKFTDVSLLDFNKNEFIYNKGIETIDKQIDDIKNRIVRRVPYSDLQKKRETFNQQKADLKFHNVQVEGVFNNEQRKYIIQSVKSNAGIVEIDDLRKSYFKLVEDEQIKSIRPLSIYNKNTGLFDLHLKVQPQRPFNIDVGGNLSTKPMSYGYIGLNYKSFNRQAFSVFSNIYFGRFYSSFNIGARMDLPSNKPFFVRSSLTMNRWDFFNSSREIFFSDVGQAYQVQSENNFRLEFGFPYETTGVVDFGMAYSGSDDEYYQTALFSQEDTPDLSRFDAFTSYARIEKKAFDYKQYPTEGFQRMFEIRYVYGQENYSAGTTSLDNINSYTADHSYIQIKARYDEFFPVNKWFTVGVMGEAMFNNNEVFQNYRATLLNAPGFYPTIQSKALFLGGLHSNQYVAGGVKGIFKVNDFLHFRAEGYVFAPVRNILFENQKAVYSEEVFVNQNYVVALEGVFHTRFGPVSAGINYYNKSDNPLYFYLNFGFLIFNKRGL